MIAVSLSKRGRTRDKLLSSAQHLVLERGLAAITVNDIAAHAEVAQGTFYNYFRTREDVAHALVTMLERAYHRDIDAVTEGVSGQVAVVTASIRQTFAWAEPDSTAGRLMFSCGLPMARFALGIRARAGRDLRAGIETGAFHVEHFEAALSLFAGGMMGALVDLFLRVLPSSAIANVTEHGLMMLGVPKGKAKKAARARLLVRPPPAFPLIASQWLGAIDDVEKLREQSSTKGAQRRPRASRAVRASLTKPL